LQRDVERNRRTGGVARLQEKTIDEKVQENGVADLERRFGTSLGVPSVLIDESGVDIVKHAGPDFANVCSAN
jgi:hypothetical protein